MLQTTCEACAVPISEHQPCASFLHLPGKAWHQQCLVCTGCGEVLAGDVAFRGAGLFHPSCVERARQEAGAAGAAALHKAAQQAEVAAQRERLDQEQQAEGRAARAKAVAREHARELNEAEAEIARQLSSQRRRDEEQAERGAHLCKAENLARAAADEAAKAAQQAEAAAAAAQQDARASALAAAERERELQEQIANEHAAQAKAATVHAREQAEARAKAAAEKAAQAAAEQAASTGPLVLALLSSLSRASCSSVHTYHARLTRLRTCLTGILFVATLTFAAHDADVSIKALVAVWPLERRPDQASDLRSVVCRFATPASWRSAQQVTTGRSHSVVKWAKRGTRAAWCAPSAVIA